MQLSKVVTLFSSTMFSLALVSCAPEAEPVNQGPVIEFSSVDFRQVDDALYLSGSTLMATFAASVSDPEGDEITQIRFLYDDESGEPWQVRLKDTDESDALDYWDADLGLYYRGVFSFANSDGHTWTTNFTVQATDDQGNVTNVDYVANLPGGGAKAAGQNYIYGQSHVGGTTDGFAALDLAAVVSVTRDAIDDELTLTYQVTDASTKKLTAWLYWDDVDSNYDIAKYVIQDPVTDGTPTSITIPDGTLAITAPYTNADVYAVRLFAIDDPFQLVPVNNYWWRFESISEKVDTTDI